MAAPILMRREQGFSLIELMIALVVLVAVVLAMANTTVRFLRVVSESDRRAAAIEIAEDRVELIALDPDYLGLESKYAGTESGFPTLQGLTRSTVIVRVGGPSATMDYKKITITVQGPGLGVPVSRSLTVGAP
jgi:prepilin-type N-terminal cleavage/methylation domain-containing protein